jgi:hypothetical protein
VDKTFLRFIVPVCAAIIALEAVFLVPKYLLAQARAARAECIASYGAAGPTVGYGDSVKDWIFERCGVVPPSAN